MAKFADKGNGKRHFVRRMFSEIVERYDFLNRSLSLGMDQKWRAALLKNMDLHPGVRMLDLACGTGDVARLAATTIHPASMFGADPVPPMLRIAAEKYPPLKTVCCESEALPFGSNTFDGITIAFGVRNFSDLELGIREARRCLSPNGTLAILEFALPAAGIYHGLITWYLKRVIPWTGSLFRRKEAYQYLTDSIHHFPVPADFVRLLEGIGVTEVKRIQYLGGLVQIYIGRKPAAAE